ncbi:Lactate dehydrogenase [Paracoccus halophilus]|uniref:2-hydroxyacid dehydrogenase n=1 Tax=Paracoccus halophilus TaxID=376733 RepID=A0A099F6K9_9RHOB|nr:2-hydroxyacid dehydrogenase [Paracoccus halophilus]KGJ06360.1 2-hydroxyacid dehydrogenase [Paracoccus halophilus]SFA38877.1 Lactate dehydrogenase [Paracoccus halophilus]
MSNVIAVGPYSDPDDAALREEFDARRLPGLDAIAEMPEAERATVTGVAFMGHEPFDGAVMDRLPALKAIANFGVGYDAIDIAAATARGIRVTNTPDVLNDDVADLAVAMWIAQARGFETAIRNARSGDWGRGVALPLARKASGRRVGILGLGRIGREIADRLAAFKCEIHYQSRSRKDTPAGWTYHADPVELARAVDDIIIAVVGGPETQGYVSAGVIGALGPDGVIVNISRGTVIDEEALIAALASGAIRGAALDVFRDEPRIDPRLIDLPNLLPLPHIGSATVETRAAMGALQRRNLRALLDGREPETPVN